MFHKVTRIFHFALQNFWRNFWLSMVTVFIITLAFLSVNFFILGNLFLDTALAQIESHVNITVYFKTTAAEQEINAFAESMKGSEYVKDVELVSRDVALQRLKAKFEKEGNPVIKDSLQELDANPLSPSVVIHAKSIDQYPQINSFIEKSSYTNLIEKKDVQDRDTLIKKINNLKANMRNVGLVVNVLFAIIAALIVFNTIRVTIYTRRKEVGIMKLVGATNWFIRAPILLESVLYSVCALILTLLLFYPILGFVQPFANTFFDGQALDVLAFFSTHFWQIIGYELLASIVLNMFSTSLAIGRYLRV